MRIASTTRQLSFSLLALCVVGDLHLRAVECYTSRSSALQLQMLSDSEKCSVLMKWIFYLLQVSTADQCRSSPKALISCNKKSLYLPPEMPAIHIEFTEYYYPDGKDFPSKTFFLVPNHKFCVLLPPLWSLILIPGWELEIGNGFLKWKEHNTAPFPQCLLLANFYKYWFL